MAQIATGTWVEIYRVALQAGDRAPQVPEDTREVPLEMRVRGFLVQAAAPGDDVEIVTASGRHLRGILTEVNPAYTHSFGPPVAELLNIGAEVRALLRNRRAPR